MPYRKFAAQPRRNRFTSATISTTGSHNLDRAVSCRIRAAGAVTVLVTIALSLPLLWFLRARARRSKASSNSPGGRGSIRMELCGAGADFGVVLTPVRSASVLSGLGGPEI